MTGQTPWYDGWYGSVVPRAACAEPRPRARSARRLTPTRRQAERAPGGRHRRGTWTVSPADVRSGARAARTVHPGRVRQPDQQTLGPGKARDGLAPRLGLGAVDQALALRLELGRRLGDGGLVRHLELDRGLRDGIGVGPVVRPEAGVRRHRQRPDAQVLHAGERVAGQVLALALERQTEEITIEGGALLRVRDDRGDAGDEFDLHGGLLLAGIRAGPWLGASGRYEAVGAQRSGQLR